MLTTVPPDIVVPDYSAYMLRVVIVLGILLLVGVGLIIVSRRWFRPAGVADRGGDIQIIATRNLEPGRRLHIVEADGQRLLLASDQGGVSLIRGLPRAHPNDPVAEGSAFSDAVRDSAQTPTEAHE